MNAPRVIAAQEEGGKVMSRHRLGNVAALAAILVALTPAAPQAQSGLLTRPIDLEPITLSSAAPLATAPYELESGKQYSLTISADGTAELAIHGAEFFRNVWINEIIINDIEIRPLGVDSIEFDAAGEAEITFVTIRPGTFTLRIPGTTSEAQAATFNVIDPMFAPGATGAAPADAPSEEGEEDDAAN
jgi:hypothetical protein